MKYAWIYDTPALAGYAAGTSRRVRAGLQLIVDDPDFRLTVPVVCLLEAYPATPPEARYMLDSLAANPGVVIDAISADPHEAAQTGRLAGRLGRAGAAHAAQLARRNGHAIVFTDVQMPPEIQTRPV